jgi:hypothetical protein
LALLAWMLSVRVKFFENLVSDAADALSDRGAFLSVATEIEERSQIPSPWIQGALYEAISIWIREIGTNVRGSVAELAHRVGPEYFAKLLVAKGLELSVIEENVSNIGGRPRVEYALVWAASEKT